MIEKIPTETELLSVMGEKKNKIWSEINMFIDENYNMDFLWDHGGRVGIYELKYRKSSKTLCALYPREQGLKILIIFGKAECEKFEAVKDDFSDYMVSFYNNTAKLHDGKWMYIDLVDDNMINDIEKLLLIKKRANKKQKVK